MDLIEKLSSFLLKKCFSQGKLHTILFFNWLPRSSNLY